MPDYKKAQEVAAAHDHRINVYSLVQDEDGEPMTEIEGYNIKMIHVVGDFGGAHVELHGEIIPGEFDVLTDYDGIPCAISSRGIRSTDDRCCSVMPRVIGGSDRTKLRVGIMLCR